MFAGLYIPLNMRSDPWFETIRPRLKKDIECNIITAVGFPVEPEIGIYLHQVSENGFGVRRNFCRVNAIVIPFFCFMHQTKACIKIKTVSSPEIVADVGAGKGSVNDSPFAVPLVL